MRAVLEFPPFNAVSVSWSGDILKPNARDSQQRLECKVYIYNGINDLRDARGRIRDSKKELIQ